ncbi:GIY-YIG nuclease family protein [Nostoc mirabile]|uniref:GIY-YIG nuclease family protein n=1 Tax=Nostoc mirabile TaxID=2907820 RepID=UPI0027DEB2CC|nr:GIY-YIG nuclease family protein [Nostoc mirabile]
MSVLLDNQLVGTLPVIPLEPNQLNLFSDLTLTPALLAEVLVMSQEALLKWKAQILDYQQRVRETKPVQQATLFDIAPNHCDPNRIDPLQLQVRSLSFWRMPTDSPGDACLYFIVDSAAGLILYVGETCSKFQAVERDTRLQGLHSKLPGFTLSLWNEDSSKRHVLVGYPVKRKPRQELELSLILKWRSPFNYL